MIEQYVAAFNGIMAEALYNTPSFLKEVIDDSASFVSSNKQFVSSNIGSKASVKKDPSAGLSILSDQEDTYSGALYTLGAQLIREYEDFFLSYPRMEETARQYAQKLVQSMSENALLQWTNLAKAKLVLSTNSTKRNSSNATSSRKKVTYNDLVNVHKKLSEDGFDTQDLICVINHEMLGDILEIDAFRSQYKGTSYDQRAAVGSVLGFEVYAFQNTPTATLNSGGTSVQSVALNPTLTTRTSGMALFASKHALRQGFTALRSHVENSATRLGKVLSTEIYAGADLVYSPAKGAVVLVEAV